MSDFRELALEAAASSGNGEVSAAVTDVREDAYRSAFRNWERRASVRQRPRRVLPEPAEGQVYFPPELMPVVEHPQVVALGAQARHTLLVQALFNYLDFTAELENVTVLPVASDISRGRCGLSLPEAARRDAYRIITDEAWHAQFSEDLLHQVARQTGVTRASTDEPLFVGRLSRVEAQLDEAVRGIGRLLFAIVSETLISAILSDLPHDPRLPNAVRDVVADHALDEGRHHAYFRAILEYAWRQLSTDERRRVGPWIPAVIHAFLEPDYRFTARALASIGLTVEQVESVLTDWYPRTEVLANAATAAAPTVRYFQEAGALEDPATRDAFLAARLVDAAAVR